MQVRHEFEDADSGDELQPELDMTYTVVSTFFEMGGGPENMEMVFTHRIRFHVAVD